MTLKREMNQSRKKPTSCTIVSSSSPSRSTHYATLLPFPLSFPSLPFFSSSFAFFFLSFLSFPLCSSSPKLLLSFPFNLPFHRIDSPLPYFGDTRFPCVILTMPSLYKLSFPCDTWSPCSFPCGIYHTSNPRLSGSKGRETILDSLLAFLDIGGPKSYD